MSQLETFKSDDYSDGRTKQAFKDSTDINKILTRAAKGDAITHLAKHGAVYGDFSDIPDLLEAEARLSRGRQIFAELPGEIRREFHQDPARFFAYVNDPANADKLHELLPGLAEPFQQLPNIVNKPGNVAEPAPEPTPPPAQPDPAAPAG